MNQDPIQLRLKQWFMRKTPDGSVRQLAQLPLAISSDIGNIRTENQDRVGVLRAQGTSQRSFLVAVLCDGMGGMIDGAECASLAAATFLSSCIRNRNLEPTERLKMAVESANVSVNDEYHEKGGATLSAFLIDSEGSFVAINVGDSRIYCFSENKLQQLSEDDTIAGQFKHDDEPSRLSNELLQFIGMGTDLEPHIISLPKLDSISQLLMTSDGTHFVDNGTMESIVRYSSEPSFTATRLIELAKWCGGKDNASVVVADKLSSLLSIEGMEASPSGMVEIWDAYGDVQLIGVERAGSPKEPGDVEQPDIPSTESKLKDVGPEEVSKSTDKSKPKQTRKKRAKPRNKKDCSDNKDKKPQIRIYFK